MASTHPHYENKDDPTGEAVELDHVDPAAKNIVEEPALLAQENKLSLLQTIRIYPRATVLCAFAAFGAISDGYQYAMPGSIVALKGFIRQFGSPDATGTYKLNPQHVALWGAFYTIAYIIVLILGTWPSDRFGRKPMLFVIQFLMAIACIIEMFATNWGHWAGAKVLNGLSVGLNQMTLMTYISEICPSRSRGAMLANYSIWWGIGKFLASVTLKVLDAESANNWRRAVYSEWVFTGCALIVWFVVPESPRWHSERGRHEEAIKKLKWINGNVKGYDLHAEYAVIQKEVEAGRAMANNNKEVNILTCFKGTNLRRTLISFIPFAWQQWGGNAVINTYTAYFFQLAGLKDPFLGSVIINVISIFCTLIAPIIIETAGRRGAILVAGVVMVATLFTFGGMLRGLGLAASPGLAAAIVTVACIWELFYASTLGVIGYVYLGETSTLLLRAKTTGVAAAGTGFLNLIVNYCTPLMLGDPSFGPGSTMLFYGGTCTIWLVIAFFVIPETKGRSYQELDELFERRIPARKFASTETKIDAVKRETASLGRDQA